MMLLSHIKSKLVDSDPYNSSEGNSNDYVMNSNDG